jgi:hypothetical protein
MIGQWFGQSFGAWFGRVATVPVNVIQPSGGWHWFRWDRPRRKRDEDEELEEALEAHLLATGTIEPETPPQKVAAFMARTPPEEVPAHVREAIKRAVRSETAAAYQLAMKRIREMEEEEDFAVLFIALH